MGGLWAGLWVLVWGWWLWRVVARLWRSVWVVVVGAFHVRGGGCSVPVRVVVGVAGLGGVPSGWLWLFRSIRVAVGRSMSGVAVGRSMSGVAVGAFHVRLVLFLLLGWLWGFVLGCGWGGVLVRHSVRPLL